MKSQRFGEQTYYDLLEVMTDAPQHEIHAAYQRAKSTYSVDSPALYTMFTQQEARELLSLIEEAFGTLSNQTRRSQYDQHLATQMAAKQSGYIPPTPSSEKVATARNELPDFRFQEEPMVKPLVRSTPNPTPSQAAIPTPPPAMVQKNISASASIVQKKDDVPSGFARTKFGAYEIRTDMEDMIRKCEDYNGSVLQKIRLYKNISLEQLIEETRIGKPYIVAIESDDFTALPAPVFARGFIVQIAKILGLNEKKAADSYMINYKKVRT